jgi:hypothetical protein
LTALSVTRARAGLFAVDTDFVEAPPKHADASEAITTAPPMYVLDCLFIPALRMGPPRERSLKISDFVTC